MKRPKACRSVSRLGRVWGIALLAAATCVAVTAHAHPGHGRDADGTGAEHYLTEPVHAIPFWGVLALAAVVFLVSAATLRPKKIRPTRIE